MTIVIITRQSPPSASSEHAIINHERRQQPPLSSSLAVSATQPIEYQLDSSDCSLLMGKWETRKCEESHYGNDSHIV